MSFDTYNILLVNSSQRYSGTTSDFKVILNPTLQTSKISLLSCLIPLTHYNVNSSNNIIYFSDEINSYSASVLEGSYDMDEVLLAIAAAMTSESGNSFTVTFNEITLHFTITSDALFSFDFGTETTNSMGSFLGYTQNTGNLLTHIGDSSPNLSIPPSIFICISELLVGCKTTSGIFGTFLVKTQLLFFLIIFSTKYIHNHRLKCHPSCF